MKNLFSKKALWIISGIILICVFFYYTTNQVTQLLLNNYNARESRIIYDRNENIIAIEPNVVGNYAQYTEIIPPRFIQLLLEAEDKYYYSHFGINPISIVRSISRRFTDKSLASSTLTQQLVKILTANELQRNSKNKLSEIFYAISLETHLSKDEILKMYVNSVYLGNNVQGIEMASVLYFDKTSYQLTESEIIQLISSLPSPSNSHPFTKVNSENSTYLAERLNIINISVPYITLSEERQLKNKFNEKVTTQHYSELNDLTLNCTGSPQLSLDTVLNSKVREITMRHIDALINKNASHAAVVVIDLSTNEIISLVGSPNPTLNYDGYQINMATVPRPIGSTIKPFIYTKGFEKGLRPYTIVDDREYKYALNSGNAFYPKNYDYQYRGPVSLHYALSNSLNVPTVKVLEYISIEEFNNFLINDLVFEPIQDINEYQLGIALGGLEMDLLTLSYYFTLFPHDGNLRPLYLCDHTPIQSPKSQVDFSQDKNIFNPTHVELTQKIITDRTTGIDQFGVKNNLLIQDVTAAVKTGTSREFHDSWTIGYTPDFLVGVWVGNTENTPMDQISGEVGAGRIWNEVMQMLVYTEYNKGSDFEYDHIHEFSTNKGIEYGFKEDDFEVHQNLMLENTIILSPHDQDTFQLRPNTTIPLNSYTDVTWSINDSFLQTGKNVNFKPTTTGVYKINAHHEDGRLEQITIYITQKE